jgi:hypothetical protein
MIASTSIKNNLMDEKQFVYLFFLYTVAFLPALMSEGTAIVISPLIA